MQEGYQLLNKPHFMQIHGVQTFFSSSMKRQNNILLFFFLLKFDSYKSQSENPTGQNFKKST